MRPTFPMGALPGWVERTIRCGDRAGGRLCQRTAPPGRRPFPDAACGLIRATALPPTGCRENAVERRAVVDPVRTSWYQGGAGARRFATRCGISSRPGDVAFRGCGLVRVTHPSLFAPGPRDPAVAFTNYESRITNPQSPQRKTATRGVAVLRGCIGSGGRI